MVRNASVTQLADCWLFFIFIYNFKYFQLRQDFCLLYNIQMDNCCLHYKETLRKPEVASLVIQAFVDKGASVDQANKVRIYQCCNLIHRNHSSFLPLTDVLDGVVTVMMWNPQAYDFWVSFCTFANKSIHLIVFAVEHQWVSEWMFACSLLYIYNPKLEEILHFKIMTKMHKS